MSDKIYYDRDDLDEDEQKLFDQMVIEEMAKLENQFLDSSIDDERRDHKLPVLQLDPLHDDMGRDMRNMSSPYVRNEPSNYGIQSQPQHPGHHASMSATNGARHLHSGGQQSQRSSRISLDAANYPRLNGNEDINLSSFSPEKSSSDARQASQEYKLSSSSESPSAPATRRVDSSSRRSRQRDHLPDSRGESSLSQIGANDPSMVSPSQKRAQQAKYAFELAEANAKSQHARDQSRINGDEGHGVKPRRRLSAEVSIEDSNIISSIGQDDQQLKERRKMLQLEYAQQLSNQQSQRHQQNPSPISSPSKIVSDASPYSSRGNSRDNYYGENSNAVSKSGLVNFGSDPDVEAEKKRLMKAAYGRQLNDQQSRANEPRSRSGESDRADARNDDYRTSPQHTNYDSREDDRNAAVSAAELKRQQQRQYHDEITNAAAAAPIHNPRTSSKNNSQSKQSSDGSNGHYSNNAGTGLQIGGGGEGGSTSFLTSADAERLESRSKKVQLQQSYAKQLSEDATVSSAGTSRNHISGAPVSGSMPGSRRGSSEGQYGAVDSRGTGRPSSGTGSGTGRGIFESMSEKDQIAAAAAKKKASQVEYFQQLQEADRKRSDPIKSSRVALNRRDQREEEGAGRGHDSSRHSSRPSSDYSQRDQNEYSGYGSSQSRHAPVGDLISARRRQQEDYARALREDAQAAPIADSYTAKRRSHHDIENYGGRGGGSGAYTSGKVQGSNYEREEKEYEPLRQGREQVREHERYQSREEERYHERPFDRYQEREPEGHREYDKDRYQQREREQDRHQDRVVSGSDPYSVPPNPYVPSYGYVEQGGTGSSRRGSRGDLQLRREETYCDTSSSGEYEPRRAEQYSPQPDRTRSRRESEEIKRQYLFGSDADGRDRQGGAGAGAGSIPDSSYSASNSNSNINLLAPPAYGRGRSSGGGASSISLCG